MKTIITPRFVMAVLCLRSIIDSESNTMSLIDLIEEIQVDEKKLPETKIVPIPFDLVSCWEKYGDVSQHTGEIRIELFSPKQVKLLNTVVALSFPESMTRLRHKVRINGLKVDIAGIYQFKLAYKDSKQKDFVEIETIKLDVKFQSIT